MKKEMGSNRVVPVVGIVDDDEAVRTALSSLIRSTGYDAALFASAEAFLRSENRDQVDCLIIDICMPGLSGLELQRALLEENPGVPVIILSVYANELRARALHQHAVAALQKPLSDDALLGAIDLALAR
jgi:FixJ family two-component response regulator